MHIGLGLSLTAQLRGGSASFDPASLFAADEPGVWYDPSDLTTLFQDTAGTSPVTTAGQTVALTLDKSQGLVLGPETVTNGTFDTDTDWTKGTGWSIADGKASFDPTGQIANSDLVGDTVDLVAVTVADISDNGSYSYIVVGTDGLSYSLSFDVSDLVSTGLGQLRIVVGALTIRFRALGSRDFSGSVDNVTVKELAGNHATQATAAARPTYQTDGNGLPYLFDDGVDDSINATIPDLGTNATLAYATDAGTTILTGQTIGAGSFEALRGVRTYSVIAVDRALTAAETTSVTAYLDAKRGTA